MNRRHTTLRMIRIGTLLTGLFGTAALLLSAAEPAAGPVLPGPHGKTLELPVLEHIPAASWVNVKTDVEPRAVGDGVADDTAALQAALDRMHGLAGGPKVVYIPPGVYRITETLVMPSSVGCNLVGHGRDTRIVWDGRTEHFGSEPSHSLALLRQNPNFPDHPDEEELRSPEFIELGKRGDNYGERIVAYIRAPQTGHYTFRVAGDDHCEVRLSPSADPDDAELICSVPGWTHPREWTKYPEQTSQPIRLQADEF